MPSYPLIAKEIEKCTPDNINYSEDEVVVPLQSMLNKTAERLCEAVDKDWIDEDFSNLELYVTIGFDSSSGHLNPHQSYTDPSSNVNTNPQQSLLVTSCIVQKLQSASKSWINPTPQSTRFCRPLRYYE